MLQRKHNKWELYLYKVRYTNSLNNDENNVTTWALPNKEWWTETSNKHEHITVHEFIKVEVTEEKLKRFKEIEFMPEDYMNIYIEYILTGDTSDDIELPTNHSFQIIRLRQANNDLKQENTLLKAQVQANTDTAEFHEELIVELAMQVYD